VPKFAVVGTYLDDSTSKFVKHVALLRYDEELRYARADVRVWHMGPPLVAGERSNGSWEKDSTCIVHLIGVVELDGYDIEGIETWLADVDKEERPSPSGRFGVVPHYKVDPPVFWQKGEDGTRLYRRFSCAGFVLDCYRYVGIDLIDESSKDSIPEIELETVASAYGPHVRRPWLREELGIPGGGPWRIILAGYLFHSLSRTNEEIRRSPHIPTGAAEKEFPLTQGPAPNRV
jgi:hypothetical protein